MPSVARTQQRLRDNLGPDADAILAHYPWPVTSDRWTGAYLEAAVLTDGGFLAGIGGCSGRFLTNAIAGYVPTFATSSATAPVLA
jgi:hypothetical protein